MVLYTFFCPDSDPVAELMRKKLAKLAHKSQVGTALVNTTRVVLRQPPQFKTEMDALVFSIGELLQNAADQMKKGLRDPRCKLSNTNNRLTWHIDKSMVLDIFSDSNGFDLDEVCLPLSLDCIGSGTGQKPVGTQAAASAPASDYSDDDSSTADDDAGGFGDGSKTGFHAMLYYGYSCQYIFFCFDSADLDRVLVWDWVVRVFDGFTEPHMAVEVTERKRTIEEMERYCARPTMVTRVRKTDKTAGSSHLEQALVAALSRFECIMYRRVADHSTLRISSKTHGSWDHRCTFEPLVDTFMGYPIALPSDPDTCLVLVSGIIYKFKTCFAPRDLVICIVGKGIPGSSFPVFNNQMREIDTEKLKTTFVKQFYNFHGNKCNTNALTTALLPFLKGGTSLLYRICPHTLLISLLQEHNAAVIMRKMLLFKMLSPRKWAHNEAEQRSQVQKRVDDAIIVTDYNSECARWYQFLCGKRDNVVVIDPFVASSHLFRPVDIHEMQHNASRLALVNANGLKTICLGVPREIRTAVKYIAGTNSDVKVVRVFEDPGDGIQPDDFRFTTDTSDIVVIYQPFLDTEKLVNLLGIHMNKSKEETGRSINFTLHFHNNNALCMAMSNRVKFAISQATEMMPLDIGDCRKRARTDIKKSRESDESDDSESEDNPLKAFDKKFKMEVTKRVTNPDTKTPVTNPPRDKVPPEGLKSISRGLTGVGGGTSAGPAADVGGGESCALNWNTTSGVFLPTKDPVDVPASLVSDLATFHRSIDMVREKVDVGRCQFFPCYAPGELWKGLHRHDGVCMINLAFAHTAGMIVGTTLHEVAHEFSSYHDIEHGRAMQRLFQDFVSRMLPF